MAGFGTRWRDLLVGAACVAVLVGLLAALALVSTSSHDRARRSLEDRFAARAALTAAFARHYTADVASRERVQAERLLAGVTVDEAAFDDAVAALELDAAVLLDARGRLLHVWPHRPEIIGRDMTAEYAHLRSAVAGAVGVSAVVPSAANRDAITAVATPFDSVAGRRVFSGAFMPAHTPLGSYLGSVVPLRGANAFLVDTAGAVLAAGHRDAALEPRLHDLAEGVVGMRVGERALTVAVADVDGAPWRVVLVAPTGTLLGPASAGRWASIALLAALAVVGAVAIALLLRLRLATALAARSARTDVLTGMANRRATDEALRRGVAHALRHATPLAVLLVDVDRFKEVNDRYGHPAGDAVLRRTAGVIERSIRAEDHAGRWGGEEFLVVLPAADTAHGALVAERIRAAVASSTAERGGVGVTVSVGVAAFDRGTPDALLRDADAALYAAKANGRDRVCVAPSRTPTAVSASAAPAARTS